MKHIVNKLLEDKTSSQVPIALYWTITSQWVSTTFLKEAEANTRGIYIHMIPCPAEISIMRQKRWASLRISAAVTHLSNIVWPLTYPVPEHGLSGRWSDQLYKNSLWGCKNIAVRLGPKTVFLTACLGDSDGHLHWGTTGLLLLKLLVISDWSNLRTSEIIQHCKNNSDSPVTYLPQGITNTRSQPCWK